MKQPRTSDFDPSASARQRTLKSSMDGLPVIEQPQQVQPADETPEPVRPVLPVRDVPAAGPARRKTKPRHPFDIYEDQDAALRELAVEDRMRGGSGSMSKMVREAIDDYITRVRASAT
jgi:hypothetical protein